MSGYGGYRAVKRATPKERGRAAENREKYWMPKGDRDALNGIVHDDNSKPWTGYHPGGDGSIPKNWKKKNGWKG